MIPIIFIAKSAHGLSACWEATYLSDRNYYSAKVKIINDEIEIKIDAFIGVGRLNERVYGVTRQ